MRLVVHVVPYRRVARDLTIGHVGDNRVRNHLSMLGPLSGGTPSFDGGLNQSSLIAGSPAGVPVSLPRLTEWSGDRRIKVLKGSEEEERQEITEKWE